MAKCPVCYLVLEVPTVACPEGHALCRQCNVTELSHRTNCPMCRHPTDTSRLLRCRPFEDLIGQLQMRCSHGPHDVEGGGNATLDPMQSMSTDHLRQELGRHGLSTNGRRNKLVARLEVHRGSTAAKHAGQYCSWRGKTCEFAAHLAESCPYEPVECPNAPAGCTEMVLRKVAARHTSETCAYRTKRCAHCGNIFEVRVLPEHVGSCPEAQVECPNSGCGETVARRSMAEHLGVCGREEVACPCPGCEERIARAQIERHLEVSGAVHLQRAWRKAVELQEKVREQGETIAEQEESLVAMKRLDKVRTRVFIWSTDISWSVEKSLSFEFAFTPEVRGHCYNGAPESPQFTHWIGFLLEEGPACTMHYKCSILGKDGKVLRVVSHLGCGNIERRPVSVSVSRRGKGVPFNLTEEDTAGAGRADGSIKLKMVVHLYLP